MSDMPPPPRPDASDVGPRPPRESERSETLAPRKRVPKRSDTPTASRSELGLILAAGFLGNLVLRTTVASLAATIAVVLIVASLASGRRVEQRGSLVLIAAALLLAPWLFIRSTPALTFVTAMAIVSVLSVGTGLSQTGSLFNSRVRTLVAHGASLTYEWAYGVAMIERITSRATVDLRFASVLRGVVLATPVLILFTALLASADEVFERLLLIGDLPVLVGHVLLSLLVALAMFAFVSRAAHSTPPSTDPVNLRLIGPVEVLTILGSLVVLFAAFVATQVVVAVGGADHVLRTEGLTAAEHARSGFFQLLWVAGLAVSLVGGLRAARRTGMGEGPDRFTPLALATLALTLVIALISVQRLSLYVGSFGMTPMRFWAMAGAGTVAVIIVIFGLSVAGWRLEQSWFPGVALMVGVALVLGLNVMNPDDFVARYNLRTQSTEQIDPVALGNLSDDAMDTVVSHIDELDATTRTALVAQLCARENRDTAFGPLEYNRSAVRADRVLDQLCARRPSVD